MNYEVFYIKLLSEEKGLVVGSIAYTVNGEVVFVEVRKNNDILDVLKDEFSSKKIYYSHNLFGDFFQIAGLIANNYKFSWLYTNSVLYGVDIMFPGKIIHLRCSFSLIPAPLFKFYTLVPFIKTSSYDTKALSRSHDYSVQKILNPKTLLTSSESLKLEVIDSTKLLYGGLLSFWKEMARLGVLPNKRLYSLGGIAMWYFKKSYNNIPLSISKDARLIAKEAYYGGRCEVLGNPFKDESILYFDFKGMYQQVMQEELPVGDFELTYESNDYNTPGFHLIQASFSSDLPVLPIKEDRLMFKEGEVLGWFWFEEIQMAVLDIKKIEIRVIASLTTTKYSPALKEFVCDLGLIRDQGGLKKEIGKLMINSFYGRLGASGYFNLTKLTNKSENLNSYGIVNGLRLCTAETHSKLKANVAVAAAITAKARIKLFKAMRSAEKAGLRLLYCDTDSIFVACKKKNLSSFTNVYIDEIYFDTSLEETLIKDAVFAAPRTYALLLENKEIIKLGGYSKPELSFNDFKKKFYSFEVNTASKLDLSNNSMHGKVISLGKDVNFSQYTKRRWSWDKKKTYPFNNKL